MDAPTEAADGSAETVSDTAADRIRSRVDLVRALYAAGKSPSRAVVRELDLECYVYPLPQWQPGELERWGLK